MRQDSHRREDVAASARPPAGLAPAQVPLFFALGFDDNQHGVPWVTQLLGARRNPDGSPVHASFYVTTTYAGAAAPAWREARARGHELGDHSFEHPHGRELSAAAWQAEIQRSLVAAAGAGVAREHLAGFRTPYLEYSDATFAAVERLGFRYDCSIEDGFQDDHDGTNFHWPYTLDRGSPGDRAVGEHPGLWELPVHPVVVPPDARCAAYGVVPGLRARLAGVRDYFDPESGKITGADWNLWYEFGMTRAEFVATIRHTLDLRRRGNRAPFMLVGHSDIYTEQAEPAPHATLADRRAALADVVDYALAEPEVRMVSLGEVLDWVRQPVPLRSV